MTRFLFALAVALAPSAARAAEPTKPNVVVFLADDMGYSDLGCYGGEIRTPNLDELAKNGLRFTNFYNTARCWPTRAAILTGYYAQQVRRDAVPGAKSGNAGQRPPWGALLPAMLRDAGYRNYHSGKWHVDGKPLQNGFDRSYSLEDHNRNFAPQNHTEDDKPLPPAKGDYFTSTAIADHALKCLKGHATAHAGKPFFSYVAFTSPHFPLQAPAADIATYKGAYAAGWDALRAARGKRLADLGIAPALAPVERDIGPPYAFPNDIKKLGPNEVNRPLEWKALTAEQQKFQAAKMEVHAAMVSRMDAEIGRVVAQLKAMKQFDNTLIVFLSDNGASAEMMVRGDGHDQAAAPGSAATFLCLGPGWSGVCNAPFRRHKTWNHEGGICTPLVAHWPKGIAAKGELRHAPGHCVDFVPTVLELSGAKAPADAPAKPGRSLVPLFAKDGAPERDLWWQHEGNRALRRGNWKAVAAGRDAEWELYDLGTDRAESKNVAKEHPEKLKELVAAWTKQRDAHNSLALKDLPPDQKVEPKKKKQRCTP